jgi:hypothetical protein
MVEQSASVPVNDSRKLFLVGVESGVELIEDAQAVLRVAFGGQEPEARLGIELGERHRGPLFKEFVQAHAALLGQPLQTMVF